MARDLDRRIAEVAARQHGVVTRSQLLEAGLKSGAVGRRLAAGTLRPLHRGVYGMGPVLPPRAWEMAAVLACGPRAWLSHGSAASAWGLRPAQEDGTPRDVTVPGGDRGRRPGIRLHRVRGLEEDERGQVEGVPVTSPARTLVDLAAVVSSRELEQAFARGERAGVVTREGLSSLVRRHAGRPGIPALRTLLDTARIPTLTRSEAEERFLELIRMARLPTPEANVMAGPYEIDFLWHSAGVAVEVDGFRFHASRASFERDRQRDAELAARGIQVIRLSWRQIVDDGVATAVRIGQVLLGARRSR